MACLARNGLCTLIYFADPASLGWPWRRQECRRVLFFSLCCGIEKLGVVELVAVLVTVIHCVVVERRQYFQWWRGEVNVTTRRILARFARSRG